MIVKIDLNLMCVCVSVYTYMDASLQVLKAKWILCF